MRALIILLVSFVYSIAFTSTQLQIPVSDKSIGIDLSRYITGSESIEYIITFGPEILIRGELIYDGAVVNLAGDLIVRVNSNITVNLVGGYTGPKFNFTVTARNSLGNLTTNNLNLVGYAACPIDLYENIWDTNLDICVSCPTGALCSENGSHNITNQQGFYQTPNTTIFTDCYPSSACEVNGICGAGYTGTMCAKCSSGYFKKGGFCKPCYNYALTGSTSSFTQTGSIMMTSFLAAFILLASFYLLKTAETGFIFVFPFFLQVLGAISTLELNWPALVTDYLGGFSLFNLNIETFAPECIGLTNSTSVFEFTFYVVLMTPIWVLIISIFVVILHVIWYTFYEMQRQKVDLDVKELQKQLEDSFLNVQSATGTDSNPVSTSPSIDDIHKVGSISKTPFGVKEFAALNDAVSSPKKKKKKKDDRTYGCDKTFMDFLCTSILLVFDFLFFPIAFQSFAFLNCSFRSSSGLYLYEFSTDRVCFESWWSSQTQLSVASIIIYLCGIAVVFWGTIEYRMRILKVKHDEFTPSENFILRLTHYRKPPFKKGLGHWSTILLAIKLVVAVLFATLSYYPIIQVVILVFIFVVTLLVVVKYEPFHKCEAGSLFMVFILLLGAVNFADSPYPSKSSFSTGMTAIFYILFTAALLASVILILDVSIKSMKLQKKRQDLLDRKVIREESIWENLKDIKLPEVPSGGKTIQSALVASLHNSPTADKLFPTSPTVDFLHDPTRKKHSSAGNYKSSDRLDLKRSTERVDMMLRDKSKRASNPVHGSGSLKNLARNEITIDESLQKVVAAKILLKKSTDEVAVPNEPRVHTLEPSATFESSAISPAKVDFVLKMTDQLQFVDEIDVDNLETKDEVHASDGRDNNHQLAQGAGIDSAPAKFEVDQIGNSQLQNEQEKREPLDIAIVQSSSKQTKLSLDEQKASIHSKLSDALKGEDSTPSPSKISGQVASVHSKVSDLERTEDAPVTNLDLGSSNTDMKPLKIEKSNSSFYAKMSNVIHNSKEKLNASLERLNILPDPARKNTDKNLSTTPVFARKDAFGSNQSLEHPDALVKPSTIKRLEMLGSKSSLGNFFTSVNRKNTSNEPLGDKSKFSMPKKPSSGLSQEDSVQIAATNTEESDLSEPIVAQAAAPFLGTLDRESSTSSFKHAVPEREKEGSMIATKSNHASISTISPSHSRRSMLGHSSVASSSHNPMILRNMGKRSIINSDRISMSPSISTINPRAQDAQRPGETPESPAHKRLTQSPASKFGSITDVATGVVTSPSMQTIIPHDKSSPGSAQPVTSGDKRPSSTFRKKASGLSVSTTSSQASPSASPTSPVPESSELKSPTATSTLSEDVTRRKKQVQKFSVTSPIAKRPPSNLYSESSASGLALAQMINARPQSGYGERPISVRLTQASPLEPLQPSAEEHGIVTNKAVQARLAANKLKSAKSHESMNASKDSILKKGETPKGSNQSINSGGMKTEATIFKPQGKTNNFGSATSLDRAISKLGQGSHSSTDSISKDGSDRGVGSENVSRNASSRSAQDSGSPKIESPSRMRFLRKDKDALSVTLPEDQTSNHQVSPSATIIVNRHKTKPSDAMSTLSPIASVSESFLESKINELASPVNIRPLSTMSTASQRPLSVLTTSQNQKSQKITSPLAKESITNDIPEVRFSQNLPTASSSVKPDATVPKTPPTLHKKQDSTVSTSSSVREIQEFSSMLGGLFGEGSLFSDSKGDDPFRLDLSPLREERSEENK